MTESWAKSPGIAEEQIQAYSNLLSKAGYGEGMAGHYNGRTTMSVSN